MASKALRDDKENRQWEEEETVTTSMNPPPQPSSQRSAGKDFRECPQTPVGRIPLSELLANTEDPRHHQHVTPIERVLWDNSPLSSATPSSIPKGKKRKRAHSSSPASSSQTQSSKHFACGKAPGDASVLPPVLKTPKANLVDDLWSRYSLHKSDKQSPPAPFNVQFPQHLHSSSPAAEGPFRDGAGLRRAFSCIDWPTSAAKRRKLRISSGSQAMESANFAKFDKPLDSVEKTKSRVSLLVERIHDRLSKPVQRQDLSSSDFGSSPSVSNENSPAKNTTLNPCSQAQVDNVTNTLSQAAVIEPRSAAPLLVLQAEDIAEIDRADNSSDFDDDDLDMGLMEALSGAVEEKRTKACKELNADDPSTQTLRGLSQKEGNEGSPRSGDKSKPTSMTSHFTDVPSLKPSSTLAHIEHFDEFSDDDEDVNAAELEGVLAKYDTQTSPGVASNSGSGAREEGTSYKEECSVDTNKAPHKRQLTIEVLSDDDDDFGGDSDFEQIAAEVAAFQTRPGGLHAKAPVCSSHREASAWIS